MFVSDFFYLFPRGTYYAHSGHSNHLSSLNLLSLLNPQNGRSLTVKHRRPQIYSGQWRFVLSQEAEVRYLKRELGNLSRMFATGTCQYFFRYFFQISKSTWTKTHMHLRQCRIPFRLLRRDVLTELLACNAKSVPAFVNVSACITSLTQ